MAHEGDALLLAAMQLVVGEYMVPRQEVSSCTRVILCICVILMDFLNWKLANLFPFLRLHSRRYFRDEATAAGHGAFYAELCSTDTARSTRGPIGGAKHHGRLGSAHPRYPQHST